MTVALEVTHKGYGVSTIVGVAPGGQEITTIPKYIVNGRLWKGTAYGGWKPRSEIPKIV